MNISETSTQNQARRAAMPDGKLAWGAMVFIVIVCAIPVWVACLIREVFGDIVGTVTWAALFGALLIGFGYGIVCTVRWREHQRHQESNGVEPDAW